MNNQKLRLVPLPKPSTLTNHHLHRRHNEEPWWQRIHDPSEDVINQWNYIFFVISLVGLFIDPLFFFLLRFIIDRNCLDMDYGLAGFLVFTRCTVDIFSAINIAIKFRTGYVSPNSRVFGRGDLVRDKKLIAMNYLKTDFAIDLAATLPLPQFIVWGLMPFVFTRTNAHINHAVALVIILQYIPRMMVIFPLNDKIAENTGVVAKTAWSGAAYNLLLYLLCSHVIGSAWYLMSVERTFSCWKMMCRDEEGCDVAFLDCTGSGEAYNSWRNSTVVFHKCDAAKNNTDFDFGIFADSWRDEVTSTNIIDKYFYCLWFGLRNLSAYGQNMETTTYIVETLYCSLICIMGLVFFAVLIGNMQSFLQSTTTRLEEWRVRRRDTEEWMRHRQLPEDLQNRVRRFVQYNWLSTRGVNEDEILSSLPADLKREIQKHLCLDLVRRVSFFSKMDDQLLNAICERLVSSINTKETYIVREGDPVKEMLFIIRGQLESSTTDGGRSGFFNSITLKPGDFCGEELLTWALMSSSNLNLPASTRTVKCITEVEAFALRAEDLKFVANQFKRLHSKKLQHAFRYYSHQWRTWGACILQAAWRRHRRRKLAEELARHESAYYERLLEEEDGDYNSDDDEYGKSSYAEKPMSETNSRVGGLAATLLASKFAAKVKPGDSGLRMPKLFKPDEPEF